MKPFYSASKKELLSKRNEIFKKYGIPALEKNGYEKSPFKTSWHGEYNTSIQGYIYYFCRLTSDNQLENLSAYIVRGDSYIKIYLNIFDLSPNVKSLQELKIFEGIKFDLPSNSITNMQLRSDDYKGPPLFYMLFCTEHKVGLYFTKTGFEKSIQKLTMLIEKDMMNINSFIKRWHQLHQPKTTDWNGNNIAIKPVKTTSNLCTNSPDGTDL